MFLLPPFFLLNYATGETDDHQSSTMASTSQIAKKIHVLLVDDDSTCRAIAGGLLRKLNYNVLEVASGQDAISTLRERRESIDIVIADVHMAPMSGLELLSHANMEFNLPVILMSADDNEETMLKGLECGALHFLVKPINPPDLLGLWQFVFSWRKGKSIAAAGDATNLRCIQNAKNNGSVRKRKELRETTGEKTEDADDENAPTRTRFCWTPLLHNLFVEAIHHIGFYRATPSKILKYMMIPGMTRHQIASHLQKFRIYLRHATQRSDPTELALSMNGGCMLLGSSSMHDHNNPSLQGYLSLAEQWQMLSQAALEPDVDMNFTQKEIGTFPLFGRSPYFGLGMPCSFGISNTNQISHGLTNVSGQENASTLPFQTHNIQCNQAEDPSSGEWVDNVFNGTSFTELLTGEFPYEDFVKGNSRQSF